MHRLLPCLLLLTASACKGPPDAPGELAELLAYLYSNHADEDPAVMEAGIEKLDTWLTTRWDGETQEFDEITDLTDDTVDSLDDVNRSVDGLLGMAALTLSAHTMDDAAYAMLAVSEAEVYPEMFSYYERTPFGDVDCFLSHECDRVETREHLITEFPMDLQTESTSYNQYLWVEGPSGTAYVHRNWLEEPPITNNSLLDCDEQFYMNLFTPLVDKDGGELGLYRIQATWMVVSQDAIPDSTAKNLTTGNMLDNSTWLEEWLDANAGAGSGLVVDDGGGCGCSPTSGGASSALALLGLTFGVWRRRR